MKKQVYGQDGKELHKIELRDDDFNINVSQGSIYNAIKNELANSRVGTASSKTRGEVKGSRRKPWRQKGTGRARAGTRQSPVWVGGGVAFGPKPRNYSYPLPKKVKRLAIRSILSLKNQEDSLKILEDFDVETGKTKDLVKILKAHVPEERTVMIVKDDAPMLKRAGRNIPWLSFLSFNRLRAHDMFYGRHMTMHEGAAKQLNEMYAVAEKASQQEPKSNSKGKSK